MAKRRREGGLTLIEILLALLVMVLGLLGILAVFPPTLQSSRESVEETTAAILAESIGHSFKNAVMFGKYDVATSKWTCVMAHDLKKGNNLFVAKGNPRHNRSVCKFLININLLCPEPHAPSGFSSVQPSVT